MKNLRLLWSLPLIAALASCGGTGSSAPAPTNFRVSAVQDSQLYMTWDATPGVEYWVFCAPDVNTLDSHSSASTHSGWLYYRGIFSGTYYATGLTNGRQYACTVNGRQDSGAGGPDATPQVATPRYAGATWSTTASTTLSSGMSLRSVAYGLLGLQSTTADQFVAVGANGQIAVSAASGAEASLAWSTPAQSASGVTTDLNAVAYSGYGGGRFVAVGAGGKVAYATNAASWAWTAASMPTTADMNAIAVAGSSTMVAVGNAGAVASSGDGAGWTAAASVGSSNNLRAVAYVPAVPNGASAYWVAVGDSGTILRSTDASNWTLVSSGVTENLKGVAALAVTDSAGVVTAYKVTAVGDAGHALLANSDGSTWTATAVTSAPVFASVSASRGQFMAMTTAGVAWASTDGSTWNNVGSAGVTPAAPVLRYNPSVLGVTGGWMVFDATGSQRLAR